MSKHYDFVDAATKTVIDFLHSWNANLHEPIFLNGYDAQDPEGMVALINDQVLPPGELEDDATESLVVAAITLCLDMADWRKVCAECGISYHEAPQPVTFTVEQLTALALRMREAGQGSLECFTVSEEAGWPRNAARSEGMAQGYFNSADLLQQLLGAV